MLNAHKKKISFSEVNGLTKKFKELNINTVCQSAKCPNIGECFSCQTATFLILGDVCTRQCSFCSVKKGTPGITDLHEPERVLQAVKELKLKYCVITSVTRDDLPDYGASQFIKTASIIKQYDSSIKVEVLVPDFNGEEKYVSDISGNRNIDVFAHNIETVPSLYSHVRQGADYQKSLKVLKTAKQTSKFVKTGIMLGLGEQDTDVINTINDIVLTGCDILTMGQYFQPSKNNCPVKELVNEEKFSYYRQHALKACIKFCHAGRYVRSSYLADKVFGELKK